jgi:hypothetical protein
LDPQRLVRRSARTASSEQANERSRHEASVVGEQQGHVLATLGRVPQGENALRVDDSMLGRLRAYFVCGLASRAAEH